MEQDSESRGESVDLNNGKSKESDNSKGDANHEEDWIQQIVRLLDMAVILTGAPKRERLIEEIFKHLETILEITRDTTSPPEPTRSPTSDADTHTPRPKRQKLSNPPLSPHPLRSEFSSTPFSPPPLKHPIPRTHLPTLQTFQTHILQTPSIPLIVTGALSHWPALSTRPWSSPSYLLSRTLGGRRLVPVEIGRSYTDEGWKQGIVTLGEFLRAAMGEDDEEERNGEKKEKKGKGKKKEMMYLAQHPLPTQIPSLRADIAVPDYCYATPLTPPSSGAGPSEPPLESPLLNAWLGPRNTISPLHTDPHENILAQVVGYKYIRLYAPDQSHLLAPRGKGEDGVDMGNTSGVDVGEMMRVVEGVWWGDDEEERGDREKGEGEDGEGKKGDEGRFGRAPEGKYVEGVLGPGECIWVPRGWWHYVRSLSGSFSVSFWWD